LRENGAVRVEIIQSSDPLTGFRSRKRNGTQHAEVGCMIDRRFTLLRISLAFAVAAGIAVVVFAHFELRPRIQKLSKEREEFKASSEQNRARAMKAETYARELSKRLAESEAEAQGALKASQRAADQNARLLIDLEEARAALHSAKQELARWNATGASPEQVASFARENKALVTQISALQSKHDRLARDYANLERILKIPFDPDAIPQLPPMQGSVLVVDPKWNFVVLDIGETNGLLKNGVLMISREGKLIGKVKVRRVETERSIADILPGWRVSEVREGDQVMN
jgi:hypothetical protein